MPSVTRSLTVAFLLLTATVGRSQTPDASASLPAAAFLGEQLCFEATMSNTGPPGFGPYLRLLLPVEVAFDSATLHGTAVASSEIGTFPAAPGNLLTDPQTGTGVTGPEGGTLTLITPPIAALTTGAPLDALGICVTISGGTALGTPLALQLQPVYRFGDTAAGTNGPIEGGVDTNMVSPEMFSFTKSSDATSGAPGSSFPLTYTLRVDVADGQTASNIALIDTLPAGLQFVGPVSITGGTDCVTTSTPSTLTPGGTLRIDCTALTGSTAANDLEITYPAHPADTLDESVCTTGTLDNGATLDLEFPAGTPLPQAAAAASVATSHLALEQSAAPTDAPPGATLTFTDAFRLSDTATATSLTITDLLGDGLTFDAFQQFTLGGTPFAIVPTVTSNPDGTTTVLFDVTAVTGNLAPGSTGTLTYTATVDQNFTPAPDPVLANDEIASSTTASYALTAGASGCSATATSTLVIPGVHPSKTVVNAQAQYAPGDTVVFRLALEVPTGDTEGTLFEDVLPLPVFDVSSIDLTFGTDITTGPNDTLGLTPTSITVDAATNTLRIEWPNVTSTASETIEIDVELTVEAAAVAAEPGSVINRFRATTSNSAGALRSEESQLSLFVGAPTLLSTLGISSSSSATADATISPSPATLPVAGDIAASDAGDTITFVYTVENQGSAPAFDVLLTGPASATLTSCVVVSVADGDGTPLASTGDFFTGGLTLTNSLAANDGSLGAPFSTDTALVTFTCDLASAVTPRQENTLEATATWASQAGAAAFPQISDSATVTIAGPALSQSIDSISPGGAGGGLVTAGDTVTYALTVTLPEGTTPSLQITDVLPAGFEYQSINVDTTGFAGTVDTSPTVSTGSTVDLGQTVSIVFDSPSATAVTGDDNPVNNSFSLLLSALALGSSSSNDGLPTTQDKTNTASLSYAGFTGPTVSDTVNTSFAEPELQLTKSISPDFGLDAGTTVTITLEIENTGTAPAYDVVLTDTLNDDGNLLDLTSVFEGTTPAGYSFNYSSPTVTYSAISGSGLAAGASVVFSFTAEVNSLVVAGSTFSNVAALTGDSQDGAVTGERSTNDSANTSASTSAPVADSKALIASSEAFTSDVAPLEAAIGEVLTFQATFTVPEGVTSENGADALVVDTLPPGFDFVTDSALVRATADTGLAGSVFGAIAVSDQGITPVLGGDPATGRTLSFDLGDLTNADDDANSEQLVFTYDVLVLNRTTNNRSDSKTNTITLNYQDRAGVVRTTSESATVTLLEPNLGTSKAASPTTVGGGSTVTFTATITNQAGTAVGRAWDVSAEDVLPARFQAPAVTSATLSRGATDVTACASFAANTLDFDMACLTASERYLDPGETITIVYTATVDSSLSFGEQVTNTVEAQATSLPGSNGTGSATPGAPGSDTGERTGTELTNTSGEATNDLTSSNSATVTADTPTLSKSGDALLQIGETTTMTVTVSVPVGSTGSFVVTDNLPSGLSYTGSTITINTPATNFTTSNSPSTTPGAGSDPLLFDFGTVTNSGTGPQDITISYEVAVDNVLANQATTALTNTATLSYTGATIPFASDAATITVSEPDLEVSKTITAGATGSDAGDTVSYQVTVQNTAANGTAYRVDLHDVLPAGLLGAGGGAGPFFTSVTLSNPGGAVVRNNTATPLITGDATFSTTTSTDDTLGWPLFDMPPLSSLTISYDAVLASDAAAGASLTNTATARYDSLVTGGGRDSADSADDDDGQLDNYGESDAAILTVAGDVAIQKTLATIHANNDFTIGDSVTFDLRVDVVEGVTENVVLTDVLPSGLGFTGSVQLVAGPPISISGAGVGIEAPAGTITIDLGDVTNAPDGNGANDFLILQLSAQVEDVAGNVNGLGLTNSASLTADVGPAGPDTQAIDVIEPNLNLTVVPSTAAPSLGDEVTWTVTVAHSSSTADAFDVQLSGVVPAGLTYVAGSTMGQASVNETDPTAPVFDLGTLTLVEMSKSFSFRTTVDPSAAVGQPISYALQAGYDSQSGSPAVERTYSANGAGAVAPEAPAGIDALKRATIAVDGGNVGIADPGDTLEYTVTLTNHSGQAVSNVLFDDTMPPNTTYVPASLATNSGTPDDSSAPDLAVVVGAMGPGATVTITYRVTVDGGTPTGTAISNQGTVDSDQTVPEPTDADGIDANGDQPTVVVVGGPMDPDALQVQKIVALLTDADTSGDVTAGDTLRYSFILRNRGAVDLTGVTLSDSIPTGLSYVAASATISGGHTIGVVGSALSATIANLPVKGFVTASFDVTVDAPLFNGDADPTSERFDNQATATSDQTGTTRSDANGHPADGLQPTRITAVSGTTGSPALDVEKRWQLLTDGDGNGLVNPGDTIGYVVTTTNSGAAPATDVRLVDTVPANTTVVFGSVVTSQGTVLGEDPVSVNLGPLDPGALATVNFAVTVDGGTPDGTVLANQAAVTGGNFAAEPSDDNGSDADGKNPTTTPVDTGGGSGAGAPVGLSKTLFATSEADSSGSQVLIGEVLTYRIAFDVPAGQLEGVAITDTLPTGLSYLPGSARLARTFDTGLSSSRDPGGVNSAASGTFVNLTDGTDLAVGGTSLTLDLGTLINSDNDLSPESYMLELRVVTANAASNQAGTTIDNGATLSYIDGLGQARSLTPVVDMVTVVEPGVQVSKTASPAAITLGGGDVQFTVAVTNPSGGFGATAYDLQLLDTLPALWTDLTVETITPSGGVSGITDNSSGTTVDVDVAIFPPGGQLVVVYTVTAPSGLPAGTTTNTAGVTWTSLPGPQGTGSVTPGSSGDADGERNGAGGGANDFSISGTADVVIQSPSLTKTVPTPEARYAIGDLISYQIEIDLPPNWSSTNTVIEDVVPEGLAYDVGSAMLSFDGGVTASSAPADFTVGADSPTVGQTTLTLHLATLANGNGSTAGLELTYTARIDNVLGNQNNQNLANGAELRFTNPAGSNTLTVSDDTSVTVGEPSLTLSHSITSSIVGLDAGDTLDLRVDVGNTGNTVAYEVLLSSVLPSSLENIAGLLVTEVTGGAETPTFINNGTGWSSSAFDVPVGSTVRIEYSAQVAETVIPGQMLQSAVDASFTSRDGSDANERDGSDAGSNQGDDSDLNNYRESDASQTVTIADPIQLDKSFHPDPGNSTYAIGETVTYRLTLSLLEGSLDDLVVSDTLPDGVRFVDAVAGLGNLGMTTSNSGAPPSQLGQTLTFDFGDLTNPPNGNDQDDFLTVDIDAVVEDLPANVDGTVLGNNALVSFTGAAGTVTRDFDADTATAGIQPLDLIVVEPAVALQLTALPTQAPQGGHVTFTVLLDHLISSSADAFDLDIVSTLPTGSSYVPGSASIPVSQSGQVLTFELATLPLADDLASFSYRATVDPDQDDGAVLTTSLELTYESRPGELSEERSYNASADATVTVASATVLDAVKLVDLVLDGGMPGVVDPGDTLAYTVTLHNLGSSAATNVLFNDALPPAVTYVPGSLTTSSGTADDSSAPLLSVSLPALDPANSASITYRVTVDGGTPAGTVISNQGTVSANETVPEPTDADGFDANGDQPTEVVVGGDSTADPLTVQKLVVLENDQDSNSSATPGDRMAYTLLAANRGSSELTNVQITDLVPAGLSSVAGSATVTGAGNSIAFVGSQWTISIPTLAAGETATARFEVTIDTPLFDSDANPQTETFVNQGTVSSDQTGSLLTDTNGDSSDGAQPTLFTAVESPADATPEMDLQKRWRLAIDRDGDGFVEPLDTLEYTLEMSNVGAAPATEVVLSDAIPTHTVLVAGSVTTSRGIVFGEDPVQVNVGDLGVGERALVRFRVVVDGDTAFGTVLSNQGVLDGSNFPTQASDDNGNQSDGMNPTLTTVGDGGNQPSDLTAALAATSEPGSAGALMLIGETASAEVRFAVPAGTTAGVAVELGLAPSTRLRSESVRLSRSFDVGLVASRNPGGINQTPAGDFAALADGVDVEPLANGFRVELGDLINSDDDTDLESYTLLFDLLVENIASNQSGAELITDASLSFGGSTRRGTSAALTITVLEADVQIFKELDAPPGPLSNNQAPFRLTVLNNGSAGDPSAYDLTILDDLAEEWTELVVASILPTGGTSGVVDLSSGTTLEVQIAEMPAGGGLEVLFTAIAEGTQSEPLLNTAEVRWTSLPGPRGTGDSTPGTSGEADGERNGSGGVNDLSASDSVEVTLATLIEIPTLGFWSMALLVVLLALFGRAALPRG